MSSHRCEGTTKAGERCKKYTKNDLKYCCKHSEIMPSIEVRQTGQKVIGECAICLEIVINNDDCGLVCGHAHHKQCLLQMKVNELCPVCRAPIKGKNLTNNDMKRLHKQVDKEKQERIAETDRIVAVAISQLLGRSVLHLNHEELYRVLRNLQGA